MGKVYKLWQILELYNKSTMRKTELSGEIARSKEGKDVSALVTELRNVNRRLKELEQLSLYSEVDLEF